MLSACIRNLMTWAGAAGPAPSGRAVAARLGGAAHSAPLAAHPATPALACAADAWPARHPGEMALVARQGRRRSARFE